MPIPVQTDIWQAQVVLRGKSGAPEDVYTNTFYFRNEGVGGSAISIADDLLVDLTEFYNSPTTNVVGGGVVASLLSSVVIETEAEIRVYDLGQPSPRYPTIRHFNLAGMGSTVLPSENAICLSYVALENQPRSRGRIYLGPLSENAILVANGRAQVAEAAKIMLCGAAKRLIDKSAFSWMLYSPTDNAAKEITGAWVDNAFDTQRRRGEKATSRHTVGTYLGQSGTAVTLT